MSAEASFLSPDYREVGESCLGPPKRESASDGGVEGAEEHLPGEQ